MDDLSANPDTLADLLNEFQLFNPECYPMDERLARWISLQAEGRQTLEDRRRTDVAAKACAEVVRKHRITRRLEKAFPVCRLVTKPASVRGLSSEVVAAASRTGGAPLIDFAVAAGEGRDILDDVTETWVELPFDLSHGDYVALPVVGESMEPFLLQRDVVIVKLGSEVSRDTVIVARKDEGYVVKYVSDLWSDEVELTSLGASFPVVRIPRIQDRILGTVVARLRRAVM